MNSKINKRKIIKYAAEIKHISADENNIPTDSLFSRSEGIPAFLNKEERIKYFVHRIQDLTHQFPD